ncbi:MAG: VWA domain-containing protein [Thermodesulfobacteriota bacterium]
MTITGFRFAYPAVLFLLVPVFLWVFLTLRRKPAAVMHSGASILGRLAGRGPRLRARLPLLLRGLALTLLVFCIARPQTYTESREISSSGVDILLCMDSSGSMSGMDFTIDDRPVERIAAVKKVVRDFIRKRENDRMGIVVFGTDPFTLAPLTLDKGLLLSLVDKISVGMAGDRTAIGEALAVSGKRLKDIPAPTKIVVLLTDGRENEGRITATSAASALAALGVKVYAVGVGSTGRVPFKVEGFFGPQTVYRDVELDEATLKEIAEATGGRYFHATDTKTLEQVYAEIDKLEKSEAKIKQFFQYDEKYLILLIPALLLLLSDLLLASRRALP